MWGKARPKKDARAHATTRRSHKIHEKLPHLTDEKLVVLPALSELLEHGRLALLGFDRRQDFVIQIALVDTAIAVVKLVGIVVRRLLSAHGVAISAGPTECCQVEH